MAENLVLSKLDSITTTPLNLVLDKYPTSEYTPADAAHFYWRFEDEPTTPFQFLGRCRLPGFVAVPFEGSGREIRISMIGLSKSGTASVTDPRAGVQTTILITSPIDNIVTYDDEIVFYDGEIVTYG